MGQETSLGHSHNDSQTPGIIPIIGLDRRLFAVVCFVLGTVTFLMLASLAFQALNYREGIRIASEAASPDHSAIIAYTRSLDGAVVKISGVFLGFALVFVGALYVLRQSSSAYSVSATAGSMAGSLQSSSPGLVLATLGVILVLGAMLNKSTVDYSPRELVNHTTSGAPRQPDPKPPSNDYEQPPESK